jgi:PAS domain S-box-containing protein
VILDYSKSYQQMQVVAARSLNIVAGLAIGGVLLALFLGFRVAASIARPLERLSAAFEGVSAGRDDVKVEVRSRDAIGSLARGFNAMVDGISQARHRLEHQAAELAQSNQQLSAEVAQRDRSERMLSKREAAYRTLAENLPGVVYRLYLREGQRIEFFNRAALPTMGSASDELEKGRICPIESLMVPDDRARVAATVEQGIAQGRPFSVEYRWASRHGELRHMLERGTPVKGADGEPLYVDGVILDITDRVQLDEVLQQQAQIIDQIHDSVITTDLDGYVTSWNRGAERLTGYTMAEALGRHISFLYPEDQHGFLEQNVIAPLKAQGAHEIEVLMRRRSGQELYAHLSLSLLRDSDGVEIGMIGYSMDITERKKAEEDLLGNLRHLEVLWAIDRAILDAGPLEAIAQAALRHIRDLGPFSAANVALFDWDAQEATVLATTTTGRAVFEMGDLIPLEAFGDLADLRRGRPFFMTDIKTLAQVTPKVDVLWEAGIRSYTSLPMLVQGELVGALSLGAADPAGFTEEHLDLAFHVADSLAIAVQNAQLIDQLRKDQGRLAALSHRLVQGQEEERHRLARDLHDEIGQTLTAVKINLQTVQRRIEGEQAAADLQDSIAIVSRALQQVRELALDLRPSVLDDLGLVPALRWYLNRQAQWPDLVLDLRAYPSEMQLPPELEVTCFRIVQEALTNVLRHARARRVEILLRQQDGQLELSVRDDGVGFDVRSALEGAARGTSIGLLGMQERARLVGGELSCESDAERGTWVHARFPLSVMETTASRSATDPLQEETDATSARGVGRRP